MVKGVRGVNRLYRILKVVRVDWEICCYSFLISCYLSS
jgi:hypothetical protein